MSIKEIAKIAGVSIGTVDRVLHGRGRVSKETEAKIKQIIKERGYKPNIFASNLSTSKEYTFGIIIPEKNQDSKYWSIPLDGIKEAQKELSNYNISVKYFFFNRHNEDSFIAAWDEMCNCNIDGLLIAPTLTALSQEYIETKLPGNIPVILFDSLIPGCQYLSYIGQDPFQSGIVSGKLMKMLVEPRTEIAVIKVIPNDYHINERAKGFQKYFSDESDYIIKTYDVFCCDVLKEFDSITKKILHENVDLSGIFVTNSATHYVAQILESFKVTKKISLIGYDLIDDNIKYLENGTIDFLISQKPKLQGYQGIYTLYQSIVLRNKVNKDFIVPIDILTKENIKYYNRQNYM